MQAANQKEWLSEKRRTIVLEFCGNEKVIQFSKRGRNMILKDIWMDVKAVQERDPAARNALEVLLLYQGVHALIWHRVAHWFYEHHMFFIARLISQVARFFTLIEIHPGAQIDSGVFIDHGSGLVMERQRLLKKAFFSTTE